MADNKNRGLYEKYRVERTNSDKPVGPCIVLELDDPNAWPALNAWTDTMEAEGYVLLADDVRRELVARGGRTTEGAVDADDDAISLVARRVIDMCATRLNVIRHEEEPQLRNTLKALERLGYR